MQWIYLSPHFDDAVLSCGGMIWEQIQAGDAVEIWTVCAGWPAPENSLPDFARRMHAELSADERFVADRRAEDRAACRLLGARARHWRLPDCIYRRLPSGEPLIAKNDDLWLPVHPGEAALVGRIRAWLRRSLPRQANLVCPLSLGNHVDHRLVRAAAEGLRRPLHYYADFPYSAKDLPGIPQGLPDECMYRRPLRTGGLEAWIGAIAAYGTQVDRLFGSADEMRAAVSAYAQRGGGAALWISQVN